MKARDALITGGAGFIGSHTAERFARGGFAVRVLDDLSTGFRHNCDSSWTLMQEDVRDSAAVDRAVAGADVVVHLAAFTSVPESFERVEDCYRTNVHGTYHVLEACRRHGVRRLVFASSSAVYAEHPDAPRSERECPEPISPYGVSKLEGEHLLGIYREVHGVASAALRFFNVYGPRQPADSDYAAAVPIFMERGLRKQPLTIYGDGSQTRDFVYVTDVAEAIHVAASREVAGVFNVGTGRPTDILSLADAIAELTASGRDHDFAATRAGDVRSSTADLSAIREALAWEPKQALKEGLQETLAWYRQQLGV